MVRPGALACLVVGGLLCIGQSAFSQDQVGAISGTVYDADFDVPLADATVTVSETGARTLTGPLGNYNIPDLPPGQYTIIFGKSGFVRYVETEVLVSAGQIKTVDARLGGDFTEMEEFIVQDIQIGGGTDAQLLQLRVESPALIDSISSDIMSQAGASDAAAALNLIPGATVSEGKFAVIRGLPDRYVNSQMNGVRLPTADIDKRAVQLDQFPSAVIESIQVSKTFTPDQQGDASGGAVNVVLKGIPDENMIKFSSSWSTNTQRAKDGQFLTYKGGGVNFWGNDKGGRGITPEFFEPLGGDGYYGDAVGVSRGDQPLDYKWSLTAGGKLGEEGGPRLGGLVNFFYEQDTAYRDNGIDDEWYRPLAGTSKMVPQTEQGTPGDPTGGYLTSLYDIEQGSVQVQWGGLLTGGISTDDHDIKVLYLFTRATEDKAVNAEDKRGKYYFFPGHDPLDPFSPGHIVDPTFGDVRLAAPFRRNETIAYNERTTDTLQLSGRHTIPIFENNGRGFFEILEPELDWTIARSTATMYEPDKRLFGTRWRTHIFFGGAFLDPGRHLPTKSAAAFTLGNLQRVWKEIEEESRQYFMNLKIPFRQWTEDEGYVKLGIFNDEVHREYNQDSFSNFNLPGVVTPSFYDGHFNDLWSDAFVDEYHPVTPGNIDVDYTGDQQIAAWYWMVDLPLWSQFKLIGGMRYEETKLSIVNTPEADVTWVPPGAVSSVKLNPGDADVSFRQSDVLPSIGFVYTPWDELTLRGSYSETVARQTFKELTPIQQQEYLGSSVFIGNPELKMSAVKNYDLRADYKPTPGSLFSVSYFYKDIKDPIEYVQRFVDFSYTFPVNYPEGWISGFEIEARQDLGQIWEQATGLTIGANATIIDSEVTLPRDEQALFEQAFIKAPRSTRDMVNAPAYLYNAYLTYDLEATGTQFSVFYTVRGPTLVAGAGIDDSGLVPDVYETEYGTLNVSLTQKIGKYIKVKASAKNLLDPKIQTVYRSDYIGSDVVKTSYTKGIDLSIGISAEFTF